MWAGPGDRRVTPEFLFMALHGPSVYGGHAVQANKIRVSPKKKKSEQNKEILSIKNKEEILLLFPIATHGGHLPIAANK